MTWRHWCDADAKLRSVLTELAYNLESFNPAFTAVLLKVCPENLAVVQCILELALAMSHCIDPGHPHEDRRLAI